MSLENIQIPRVNQKRYQRKIMEAKRLIRTDLKPENWNARNLCNLNLFITNDQLKRVDYHKTSEMEFIERFESKNIPAVIIGALDGWNLDNFHPTKLAYTYRHEKFKVGEDDDENVVYLGMKYFMHYSLSDPNGAAVDDSPLYIFDANFGKRNLHHSSRRSKIEPSKHRYDPNISQATCHLVDDYQVPKYFQDDLFSLVGARRPPFRWIVCGSARSGTGIHVDPLGTSAWNALVYGHKRWALFPPRTPKHIIDPKLRDNEAITWFNDVYPKLQVPDPEQVNRTLAQKYGIIEILQKPGETVFVPSGSVSLIQVGTIW
jgi:histone arginine demethylase JMJD6